jgi:DNA polymerase-4
VSPDRPTQSISAEDTFADDRLLADIEPVVRELAAKVWAASRGTDRVGRTVVLKLKTREFRILTRSHTPPRPPCDEAEFIALAIALIGNVGLADDTRYRLAGVGFANFRDDEDATLQAALFERLA